MQYFGQPWNELNWDRVKTPVGKSCSWCEEVVVEGDRGVILPSIPEGKTLYHLECFLRQITGSVGHQRKTCSCFGGREEDPKGMTLREAARAAVDEFRKTHD